MYNRLPVQERRRRDPVPVEVCLAPESWELSAAMEAEIKARNLGVNVEGTPLKLELMGDHEITMNGLPQVKNAMMFQRGNIPTDDGLFSYEIFGSTSEKRRLQYAYIDLGRKFFHPYVYECLTKVNQNIERCAAGMDTWAIADGKLVKTTPEDESYDEYATGLRWLIDNYDKLKFDRNESYVHNQYVDVLLTSKPDQIFITKFVVIPVMYRDVSFRGNSRDIPEINDMYKRLLQLVNAMKSSSMALFMNNTEKNIQDGMVTIRRYGQELIKGKRGFIKQHMLGKNTVYAARNVITQPSYANAKLPRDIQVDMFHTGFPIATCCSMGYPFIEHWITNFIHKEFVTKSRKQVLHRRENGTYEMKNMTLGDVAAKFTPHYIKRKTEQFMETYGKRFEPVTIPMADGSEMMMLFTGSPYSTDPRNPKAPATARRPMTWTDLLYLACVNTLEFGGKMAYVTRYPLVDYFGTFPSMIRVTSTVETAPMEVNGVKYPFYPVINAGDTMDSISTQFCDTVTMDNIFLDGIGGDYDGDTTSEKMMFSDEANEEAFNIMTDVTHFVSIGGKLVQMIKNEAYLTFYNMTRLEGE